MLEWSFCWRLSSPHPSLHPQAGRPFSWVVPSCWETEEPPTKRSGKPWKLEERNVQSVREFWPDWWGVKWHKLLLKIPFDISSNTWIFLSVGIKKKKSRLRQGYITAVFDPLWSSTYYLDCKMKNSWISISTFFSLLSCSSGCSSLLGPEH